MSNVFTLAAENRDAVGKGVARALRRDGRVPAIIYGDKKPPQGISFNANIFNRIYSTGRLQSTLVDIDVEGKTHRVIARDVQLHPVRDTVIHVDFLRLTKDSIIAIEIPVRFLNEEICPGIKTGGVLNVVRYTVELNCPANSIPDAIYIDLVEMNMGDSVHISSVELPEGVKPVIDDRDFTIATIAAPAALRSEEEEAADAAEAAEAAEGAEGEDAEGEGGEKGEAKDGAKGDSE